MAGIDTSVKTPMQEFEPLDTLQMRVSSKNGVQTTVSGIHIGFMETRYYVHFYLPPPSSGEKDLSTEEEEWLEYMTFLEEDLHWLLKLPHHRFWSQVVYDEALHQCLESYLSQAPRDYNMVNLNIKEELLCALKKIHKLVFLAYLRMSTYKESKKHHITPHAFGEIIYDNFIFDISKIMDLYALYGQQNSPILNKMVQNIFSTQPKYTDDLDETSKVTLSAFNSIEEKLLNLSTKPNLNKTVENGEVDHTEFSLFCDVTNYITDVSFTIYAFLENFSPACQTFYQNGAILRIPTFYEQVFPVIEMEIAKKCANSENGSVVEELKRKVILSKTLFIKIFRCILDYTCIQNILNSKISDNKNSSTVSSGESFLDIIMELVISKSFLCEYNILYPLETDLEFFNEIGIHLDSERVNYLFSSIYDSLPLQTFTSTVENGARQKVKKQMENIHKPVQNIQDLANILKTTNSTKEAIDGFPQAENDVASLSENEINKRIQSVLDILPAYGEGFIEKCLEHFAYNPERVVDAVLKNCLPDHLIKLDKNFQREHKASTAQGSYPNLSERKCVFDNDEFDMFNRNDVNMDNVHLGKKNKTPATYQSLRTDEESQILKQLTLAYDEAESNSQIDLYEDEYDDTYDSTMVSLKGQALGDEPDDDDEEEEEERSDASGRQPNSQDFCINPEILRERAEQRRQAKYSGRSFRGGSSRSTDQPQGRQQKDRQKAHVGNHNRKRQSDFKRSRGMGALPTR